MSDDFARILSGNGRVPTLTKGNYLRWQTALKAYWSAFLSLKPDRCAIRLYKVF
jgi:hypothetical protein